MRLYEINEELRKALEAAYEEAEANDGVIPDEIDDEISRLEMKREEKISWIAQEIVNQKAAAEALKAQKLILERRQKTVENRVEWLKNYVLMPNINPGEKYTDDKVSISWRKSESVEIDTDAMLDQKYFKLVVEPSKSLIKDDLKAGIKIDGARIVEKQNLIIK